MCLMLLLNDYIEGFNIWTFLVSGAYKTAAVGELFISEN